MWDYGDDNRGPEMAAIALVMTSLSVIAVALRCYTMITILKRFLVEDWLAVLTCLLQCAFCAFVILGVSHGLGAHVEHVPEDQRPKALIFKWAGQIAYIVVSTMVKFVVGIFLLRLCVNNGWQRITIWVLLVLVGLFNIFYVFVAVFQCQPVPYYWWRYAEDAPITGTCNGKKMATIPTYIAVLLGIAGDLILALLPITLIKHAKLDKKTKISVICVLSLGSLLAV
ncbi:putative cation-transporting atpase 4 [Diaporthe ampelina]|uniref:Putative cation-transporting atpase 4 n=1 Tax=Diaporthe ampelina TaxID=1214573 RepID=A0A0G2HCZ0_9PEZI|nr:putative cation-transporting atpase 4 [Diaporthe ampelina]